MHLLHTGAKVSRLEYGGTKFIKFEFQSVDEAKYRAAAFALKIYKFYS